MFLLAVLSVFLADAAVNTVYAQQSTTFTLLIPDQEDSSLSNDMKENRDYPVLDGADSTYTVNVGDSVTIRIDCEMSKFLNVEVDSAVVDSEYYKVESGSTVVTFAEEYLNTLSEGIHTVKFIFTDGSADTTLTVRKSQTTLTGSGNGQPSNNNSNNMKPSDNKNPVSTTNTITNSKAAKTGDNSAIMLWLFMALIASGGITVCIMRFRKQK